MSTRKWKMINVYGHQERVRHTGGILPQNPSFQWLTDAKKHQQNQARCDWTFCHMSTSGFPLSIAHEVNLRGEYSIPEGRQIVGTLLYVQSMCFPSLGHRFISTFKNFLLNNFAISLKKNFTSAWKEFLFDPRFSCEIFFLRTWAHVKATDALRSFRLHFFPCVYSFSSVGLHRSICVTNVQI